MVNADQWGKEDFLEESTLELGLEAWVEFHLEKVLKGM